MYGSTYRKGRTCAGEGFKIEENGRKQRKEKERKVKSNKTKHNKTNQNKREENKRKERERKVKQNKRGLKTKQTKEQDSNPTLRLRATCAVLPYLTLCLLTSTRLHVKRLLPKGLLSSVADSAPGR